MPFFIGVSVESRINYTLVGIFVLLLGAAGIIIPLWLSSGLDQQQYTTYMVYMNEAVDGLSVNAPVNYNGVNVGYVKDIQLNTKNTAQVQVRLNIKEGTPITTNTTATLQSQGVTGFAYVGLNGGAPNGAKTLVAGPDELYPQIKSTPSIRVRLDTALTQLMNNLTAISQQLNAILTPHNQKMVTNILDNTNKLTLQLTAQAQVLQSTTTELHQNLPATLAKLQDILRNMQTITTEIKENPSVVVRGKAKPSLGPGEK
jgi:phospholipid/cholesterol/gamma-HCH transport system substrate-binding protein